MVLIFKLPNKRYFAVAIILAFSLGSFFINIVLSDSTLPIFSRFQHKLTNMWDPRFTMWIEILSHPFSVYGHSYETFGTVSPRYYPHPHNLFVELYAYYGVIGLVVFGVVLAGLIKSLPLVLKGHVLPMVLLVLFIYAMLDGNFRLSITVLSVSQQGCLSRCSTRSITVAVSSRDSLPGKVSTH